MDINISINIKPVMAQRTVDLQAEYGYAGRWKRK